MSPFLLNISNSLFVTTKPPPILTEETRTEVEASAYPNVCGRYPPPITRRPPAAVIPDIAFVTDINGVCNAGTTPQTD